MLTSAEIKTAITVLQEVTIYPERRSGNTERIINKTVNYLFKGNIVKVIDHHNTSIANEDLLRRLIQRLDLLHVQYNYRKLNNNYYIKIKPYDFSKSSSR